MDNDVKMEAEGKTSKVEENLVRPRRSLADISNLPQQHQVVKPNPLSKECVDRLQKENMMLIKALTDRNKIIELSEIEIQKLKVSLQIMQQQNAQLARANTQMLAELNSGKDRLMVLQHELGCKDALLKMRNLEMEENAKDRICNSKEPKLEIAETSYKTDKPRGTRRKQQSKSQCPTSADPVQANEIIDSKRQCKRRQSGRFRMEEPSDIGKNNSPPQHVATTEENSILNSSIQKENEEEKSTPGVEDLISRRSSIARPSRRAAAKVQSYKEIPLNAKMRRAS